MIYIPDLPMLTLGTCMASFRYIDGITRHEIEAKYNEWAQEFTRHACNYYDSLGDKHYTQLAREFKTLHELSDYWLDDLEEYPSREREFKAFLKLNGYDGVKELCQEYQDRYRELSRQFPTAEWSIEEWAAQVRDIQANPTAIRLRLYHFSELWFEMITRNMKEERDRLKALPYKDYLQSRHWQRTRGAMLIINNAVCQEASCFNIGEGFWYGGNETDVHVHHLSYQHLGGERYEDVALLCNIHREEWHRQKKAGKVTMDIVKYAALGSI